MEQNSQVAPGQLEITSTAGLYLICNLNFLLLPQKSARFTYMISAKGKNGLRTWIEIDRKALSNNYSQFRKILSSKTKLMSVVKSNAYGHGLIDFSHEVEKLGVDWLGVDSIVEGIALRKSGIKKPILVLGFTLPEMLRRAARADISVAVSTFELLETISKISFPNRLNVHIKVDTGMHRQGFQEYEIEKVIRKLKDLEKKIRIEGLFTHFAAPNNPKFKKLTDRQCDLFDIWRRRFKEGGFNVIAHAGASNAALMLPKAHFDMVRIGIALHGMWPSKEVEDLSKEKMKLKPILQWKTIVGEVKKVSKGNRIGYGFVEELRKDTLVAICPIGYWHGYPRHLSGLGSVLIRGKRAKLLGTVTMDMIMIDVTHISGVRVGDEVTLIGKDGAEVITPEELADLIGTSSYEIVTRINPLIKRIYY
jgi:alanine racemase